MAVAPPVISRVSGHVIHRPRMKCRKRYVQMTIPTTQGRCPDRSRAFGASSTSLLAQLFRWTLAVFAPDNQGVIAVDVALRRGQLEGVVGFLRYVVSDRIALKVNCVGRLPDGISSQWK